MAATYLGRVAMVRRGASRISVLRSLEMALCIQLRLTSVSLLALFMTAPILKRESFSSSVASLMSSGPAHRGVPQSNQVTCLSTLCSRVAANSSPLLPTALPMSVFVSLAKSPRFACPSTKHRLRRRRQCEFQAQRLRRSSYRRRTLRQ